MYQEFKDLFYKIGSSLYVELTKYYNDNKKFFDEVIKKNNQNPIYCQEYKSVSNFIIYILILFFIISVIWLFYEIFRIIYLYIIKTIYYVNLKNNRLVDNPLFIQLNDFVYVNDYFSYDTKLFWFIITIIFLLVKIQIFELLNNDNKDNFNMLKIFCYLSIIFCIIYYIINYRQIIRLGRALNISNRIIYNNINIDFIKSQNICNYLHKKNEIDYKFVYGKCNDVDNNISINKLYDYIKSVVADIEYNIGPLNNINITKFKTLADKNGILYKDRIISALFTYQLLKYFIDNDLIEEAKDFFSAFNIIYSPNINLLRQKINPFLFIRDGNILIFDNIYEYNYQMKEALKDNKLLYDYLYSQYTQKQNIIEDILVEIFNICNYKLISIYMYFLIILLMIIILTFYYYLFTKK